MYKVKNKDFPFRIYKSRTLGRPGTSVKSKHPLKVNQDAIVFLLPKIEISDRETDIIRLLGLGKTSGEIAEILNISPHTVQSHKKNLLKKTHCNNTTHLVASCIRSGIIK